MKTFFIALLLLLLPVASYAQKMPDNCKATEEVLKIIDKQQLKMAFTGYIKLEEKKLTVIYVNEEAHTWIHFLVNGSMMCQLGASSEGYMLWTNPTPPKTTESSH